MKPLNHDMKLMELSSKWINMKSKLYQLFGYWMKWTVVVRPEIERRRHIFFICSIAFLILSANVIFLFIMSEFPSKNFGL